jgi:NADH-quinone oxidoreductase subunit N
LTTIPLFVLAAYRKDSLQSSEAGLKYLILGAVSSAILLYGISMIYGLTGTTFINVAMEERRDAAAYGMALVLAVASVLLLLVLEAL